MNARTPLILLGAGGAGLEALMVARRIPGSPWDIVGFADDAVAAGTHVHGVIVLGPILPTLRQYSGVKNVAFHCGLGSNVVRARLAAVGEELGLLAASLVDPTAVVAESSILGAGCYVGPHAFVGPDARVGRHVLVNVGASVGHHAEIGDFSQLCPGARVSGKCRLGSLSFVGSNGVVAPGVALGARSILGAASMAVRDVPDDSTAVGVPAKVLAAPPRAR